MNWAAAGVFAEMVGAIAVVVSLLFLATEVRRNRNATESASVDALAEGFNSLNAHLMDSPDLASIWLKGMSDPESMTEVESLRFIAMMQSYLNHFTTLMKYHEAGLLPEEQWQTHYSAMHHIFNSTGGKWLRRRINFTPTARAAFDATLESGFDKAFWFAPNSTAVGNAPANSLNDDD